MEATQESTQPCTDPRRGGLNNSGLEGQDLEDVICILHPSSPAALEAVAATAHVAPWHILQQDMVHGGSLDIALRLSSKVKDPNMGFCFGRTLGRSDILLAADSTSRRISNTHFRIYLTEQSILMLEDMSTNGTIVDDFRLRKREKDNSRMLVHGSVIQVVNGENSKDEVKFVVRVPSRDGHSDTFNKNLEEYIDDHVQEKPPGAVRPARRLPSTHSLQSWNTFGMHWSGGPTYNVTGQIGKGAFAVVYKLATKQHGHVFACKELDKRRFMKNGVLDQKVDNEMRIMKDLKHPNIVQFIEHKEHDRWFYIIMEYVPCGELSAYLAVGKLQEDMVQTIARQLLHALRYLHKRKITHRDIKPDNILIASHDPLKVKLSDFGLSKVVQEETFLKTFCGTLLYCAPEVYPEYEMYRRGEVRKRRRLGDPPPKTSPYDQSVDMYSLGAVLYHILAGIPPYTGRGDDRGAQMLRTIMTTEPNYNILRSAGVSEAGVDFVSELLNRDPQLRPKERECLKHPWIVDVPDLDEYEDDMMSDSSGGLSDIGEDAEDLDAEDLDASQISLEDKLDFEAELAQNDSDLAQSKRPRIESPTGDIHYPSLPSIGVSPDVQQSTPRRLFGEITSSALRSSHALGDGMDAFEDSNFSIHDFVSSTGESMISDGMSLNSVLSLPENPVTGSALSLLGAENLVQQLNMNSWHPGTSSNPLLSTERPNPRPSKDAAAGDDEDREQVQQLDSDPTPRAAKFSRRIELPIPDTASERSSSDDSATRHTTGLDSESATSAGEIFDIELANTMDAKTGLPIADNAERLEFQPQAEPGQVGGPVVIPRLLISPDQTRPLFGKLTTVPGSILDLTLPLEGRMTSWGRGPLASICHPDPLDARVPAYALEVTFWTPGIEPRIASGQDWKTIPGLMSVLSTKTRKCIWVNDIELRKGPDGRVHYGKLYTGDIITIYRGRNAFLKFRCEFYIGDSVRERPEHEKGFSVRRYLMAKDSAANQQTVQQKAFGKD